MNEWLPKNILKKAVLQDLQKELDGELFLDDLSRVLYATDASVYRELPLAVAYPKHAADLQKLVRFAARHLIALIPRAAGTSLAGQVVGNGIVVDVSRYMTRILELNVEERWVRVEPGVIRDELNMFLKPHGLFFAPETSTSNRAMIGGMIGNNACGATSLWYGSTREHVLALSVILSDASEHVFSVLPPGEFELKRRGKGTHLSERIYEVLWEILSDSENQRSIEKEFPKSSIKRRNTGYALDELLCMRPFAKDGESFNLCKLLVGSEGTLALTTEAVLNLSPLPPAERGLLCVHCKTLRESLQANLVVLPYEPFSVELIDRYILECTKTNILQSRHSRFVQGDPQAILIVELASDSTAELREKAKVLKKELGAAGLGYYFPLLTGPDIQDVWALRKAALGLLSNIPGDAKPVPVIEDTAIAPEDLPDYIEEFNQILVKYSLSAVHYGHVASGELHLRPILNLKEKEGQKLFRLLAEDVAKLVKKYRGSLSGEHGDGRLRGEFIPYMIGERNFKLLRKLKEAFDPNLIFNPGKILDTPPMDYSLRYRAGEKVEAFNTVFHFRKSQGLLRAVELCNGSGDCRKTIKSGGVMCPSYMATLMERDTTRARANILREFLSHSTGANKFDHDEIHEILDHCLSCKGCASECPSNVDIAKLKAEALQQIYDARGVPIRSRFIGNFASFMQFAAKLPKLANMIMKGPILSFPLRRLLGIARERSLPLVAEETLRAWFQRREMDGKRIPGDLVKKGKVLLFCDEFTDLLDVEIGKKAIELLEYLGYQVEIPFHRESGRTQVSKGLLRKAKTLAEENIKLLSKYAVEGIPIVGIEPSAVLSFRDEYIDLVSDALLPIAKKVAQKVLMIDEFIAEEMQQGRVTADSFVDQAREIYLHGHCHQKTLSSMEPTVKILSLPPKYRVHTISAGCCGMAGFFGYEKEHYDLSMQIGELALFPAIRALPESITIAAVGTSCRAQILDGTGRQALHPVEILWEALRKY